MPDSTFMKIGKSPTALDFLVPWPSRSGMPVAAQTQVKTIEVGDGTIKGQKRAGTKLQQQMAWHVIKADAWWELNRWFEANGYFFWCYFYDHIHGEWVTRQYRYIGANIEEPSVIGRENGMPNRYYNAVIEVEDTGKYV